MDSAVSSTSGVGDGASSPELLSSAFNCNGIVGVGGATVGGDPDGGGINVSGAVVGASAPFAGAAVTEGGVEIRTVAWKLM